jgi:hypothetical protein
MNEGASKLGRTDLPEHLVELPGGDWALWRWAGLRGAGFPATNIFKLSAPAASHAENLLAEAIEQEQVARDDLLKQINAEINLLRQNNEWEDIKKRRLWLKAISSVKAGKIPDIKEIGDAVDAYRSARGLVDKQREEFRIQYESSTQTVSNNIREIACSDRFREAILWQNRDAYHRAIDFIVKRQPGNISRNSRQKRDEELVANYLQRYCVKNDTIGFFGPVGWARFVSNDEGFSFKHGKGFVTDRKTYFEVWAIDTLAKHIASNKAFKPWLRPVSSPLIRVEETILFHPLYGPVQIPALQSAIIGLCNGNRTAREIIYAVMQSFQSGMTDEGQGYALLEHMESKGLLSLSLEVPTDAFPEKALHRALEHIGDYELRAGALAVLSELEEARSLVEASAGNADDLDQALGNLNETFTRIVGIAPTRGAGKTYAGRTLVYEDCRRDMDVQIGTELLKPLADPLSLLLISGRWISCEFAKLYRRVFDKIFEDMARKEKSRVVDAGSFWVQAMPFVYGERSNIADPILENFKRRWEKILLGDCNKRRIQYCAEQLRPKVLAEFAAPGPGWSGARYHSPDIIIFAPDQGHINRGDYQFVLGEFHLGKNTLGASTFFHQHPSPQDLIKALEQDLPSPRVVPVLPAEDMMARTTNVLISPNDFCLEIARNPLADGSMKNLRISSFFIEKNNGELVARTADGEHQFNLIEIVGTRFSDMICNSFRYLAARPHTPRITIDRFVLTRETWSFSAPDLNFAFEKDEMSRFLGARRWARNHCMPRFVFTKVLFERKPVFLDFDSPIYVEIFSRMVRHSAESAADDKLLYISEMLPGPDKLWLEDTEGRRYTSELRIVALDLAQ